MLGKWNEQKFFQRIYTNGKQIQNMVLNVIIDYIDANKV